FAGDCERPPLACEEMARQAKTPPRDFIDSAQHCLDVAGAAGEAPAFHRRKRVALEHHARRPAALDVARQTHGPLFRYSAATARSSPLIQRARSTRARRVTARFFASPFSAPRSRCPCSPLSGCASGGNRPKLTFIGW